MECKWKHLFANLLCADRLISLKERGLNQRYMKYYNDKNGIRCSRDHNEAQSVTLTDALTTFLIIFCGSVIANIVFLLELLYKFAMRRLD